MPPPNVVISTEFCMIETGKSSSRTKKGWVVVLNGPKCPKTWSLDSDDSPPPFFGPSSDFCRLKWSCGFAEVCSDQSRETCSSPEVDLLTGPSLVGDRLVPPNITITSSHLPLNVEKLSAASTAGGGGGGVNTMMEVHVPKVITTPNFELKLVEHSVEKTRSNFQNILAWMEKNDSYFSSYKRTSLADLLETPEIANNQSSSFTKTLYAMKGTVGWWI